MRVSAEYKLLANGSPVILLINQHTGATQLELPLSYVIPVNHMSKMEAELMWARWLIDCINQGSQEDLARAFHS